MQKEYTANRHLNLILILLVDCFFQPAERGGSPTDAGVTGLRIVLEQPASCKAVTLSREKSVEEPTVVMRVNVDFPKIPVLKAPADVVMATDVVNPRATVREMETLLKRM